jgi:hypothetical protein
MEPEGSGSIENFSTRYATVSFSTRALLCGVGYLEKIA